MPKERGNVGFRIFVLGGIVVVASVVALQVIWYHWILGIGPIRSEDAWPWAVDVATDGDPEEVKAEVRVYSLGGLVDSEYIWRMNASPERVALLTQKWSLSPIEHEQVPYRFWKMSPDWWCTQELNDHRVFLASDSFPADERGLDGEHFFLMYEPDEQLLFVWFKDNF